MTKQFSQPNRGRWCILNGNSVNGFFSRDLSSTATPRTSCHRVGNHFASCLHLQSLQSRAVAQRLEQGPLVTMVTHAQTGHQHIALQLRNAMQPTHLVHGQKDGTYAAYQVSSNVCPLLLPELFCSLWTILWTIPAFLDLWSRSLAMFGVASGDNACAETPTWMAKRIKRNHAVKRFK